MEEYGQPMHSFDYDTVAGHTIIVRRAEDGEVFTTLDGQKRNMDHDVLMICDAEKEIGIAGIMGGENSMITDSVKNVLFEAACFDGTNIRHSSKRIGLQTDASGKFDKGIGPNVCIEAINRACQLMEEFGAGEVVGGTVDVHGELPQPTVTPFEPEKINALLGTDVDPEEMIRIFEKEGLTYDKEKNAVIAPTWRQDLHRMCDYAEEVARFHGYDKIPTTLPSGEATSGGLQPDMAVNAVVRQVAEGNGFLQGYCYSFESPKVFDKLLIPENCSSRQAIRILNPLGEDFSIMRTLSLNGILTSLATNANRRNKSVRLYEMGNVYIPKQLPLTELPDERMKLTLGMYGDGDFFDLKGVMEMLLIKLGMKGKTEYLTDSPKPFLHPGRQASVVYEGKTIGFLGEVHPQVRKNYEIDERAYVCVMDMPSIYPLATFERKFVGIPKYPAMTRDISMVVPKNVTNAEIEAVISQRGGKILESCVLFDIYEGAPILPGFKSMAYNLTFRHADKTLGEEEVGAAMKKILNGLQDKGITLR